MNRKRYPEYYSEIIAKNVDVTKGDITLLETNELTAKKTKGCRAMEK